MSDTNIAIDFVLDAEDPTLSGVITTDTGGRTRWGISEKFNPEVWKDGPPTLEQARAFYAEVYIAPHKLSGLQEQNILNAVLDCMVNQGNSAGFMILRHALEIRGWKRAVDSWADLIVGLKAVEPGALLVAIRAERCMAYYGLVEHDPAKYGTYLRGWIRRAVR